MSDANIEIVRRMLAAFHRGDGERALAHFHPDVVVDATMRVDGGIAHGHDGLSRTIGQWVGAFENWREEVDEIRAFGDTVYVAATQYGRGKTSGIEVPTRYGTLYEVRGGKITRLTLYADRSEALRAARAED
jgi:ketosteroid isomerase-like protein